MTDSEIRCHNEENGQSQNPSVTSSDPLRDSQEAIEMQERSDRSFQCTSSSSNHPQIPKLTLKPKILLVEDSKINVMVTKSMMKQLGHSIDVVNNGVEAVCAVQSCRYDLLSDSYLLSYLSLCPSILLLFLVRRKSEMK